jgi:spore coat protein CotH
MLAAVAAVGCSVEIGGEGGPPGADEPTVAPPESSPTAQSQLVIFDDSRLHQVKLYLSAEDWQSILDDSRGDELRPATVSIDGVVMANVGIRPAGESSRVAGNGKMSIRLEFDAFQSKRMGGFDEVKLSGSWDDPFIARDRLAYWVYGQVMPAPREVPARLTVNGEDRGIFQIEEIWGRESLATRFSNPTGPLYRIRGLTNLDPYQYKGPDPAAYVPLPWDPNGMRDPTDHLVIGPALQILAENPSRLGEVMDIETLLTYFAVSVAVSNTDGFTGTHEVDDHFQYYDPTTLRFFILPWDPDNTFGSINDLPDANIFLNYERSILTRLLQQGPLRDAFFTKIEQVMQRVPPEAIHRQVDFVAGQIWPVVRQDKVNVHPIESFEWSVGYIKDWIAARYASIRAQIATLRAAR